MQVRKREGWGKDIMTSLKLVNGRGMFYAAQKVPLMKYDDAKLE